MRRRNVSALIVLIIATILLCPVSEMFDHWDHSARTHKDTESSLMLVAGCAGAAIAVIHANSAFLPCLVAGKPEVQRQADGAHTSCFVLRIDRLPERPPPLLPLRI